MRRNAATEVLRDNSGSMVVEFGLLVLFVSAAAMLALAPLGETFISMFERITDALRAAAG